MLIVIESIAVIILVLMLCVMMTLSESYVCYRKTYSALNNHSYIYRYSINGNHYYTSCNSNSHYYYYDRDTIIFFNSGSIKLIGGNFNYIHNSIITYIDPYTLYWSIKIKKWFKLNRPVIKSPSLIDIL